MKRIVMFQTAGEECMVNGLETTTSKIRERPPPLPPLPELVILYWAKMRCFPLKQLFVHKEPTLGRCFLPPAFSLVRWVSTGRVAVPPLAELDRCALRVAESLFRPATPGGVSAVGIQRAA